MKFYRDVDWLREKYWDGGLTLKEIGELCGVGPQTVARWMKKHSLPTRWRKRGQKGASHRDAGWLREKYWDEELSFRAMSKLCDVDRETIRYWMKKHNIPWIAGGRRESKIERTCIVCEMTFFRYQSEIVLGTNQGKFCSQKCTRVWKRREYLASIKRTCIVCGVPFDRSPARVAQKGGKFCSRKCHGKWRSQNETGANSPLWKERVECVCLLCGVMVIRTPSHIAKRKNTFCSLKCANVWQSQNPYNSGEDHPNWQGGPSLYPPEFNECLRREIRKRDNHTCAICGKPNSVEVHHIDYDKQNSARENLIVLCSPCHGKINRDREYWQTRLEAIMKDKVTAAKGIDTGARMW